jgi:hypothetical protein
VAGAKFYVQLDWTGDVYLEWYCSDTGEVTGVDITGPDQPTQKNIPRLNAEFNRAGEDCPPEETECSECGGLFYVKIGNINEDGIVTQNIDGNFFWSPTIFQGSCDASSESSSESSPESSSSPESPSSPESSVESSQEQSSKSTAIVPVSFYETGYAAVYTMEAPDIRFEDVFQDLRVRGRRTEFTIDPRFLEVCEPGTLRVVGVAGDLPHVVGAVITDCGKLALTASMVPILRPRVVNVKISGIRKGFLGIRFGKRTRRQFVENEATLNASYSGYADSDRH